MIRVFVFITFTWIVSRARVIAAYRALANIRSNIMSIACTPINYMSISGRAKCEEEPPLNSPALGLLFR